MFEMSAKQKLGLEPPLDVLTDFVHNCSPNESTRTIAVTAMVLTFWQGMGRWNEQQTTSLLLVNVAGTTPDPMMHILDALLGTPEDRPLPKLGTGNFAGGAPENAPAAMLNAVQKQLSGTLPYPGTSFVDHYNDARVLIYGRGDINTYAKAWHPELQLITDTENAIILQLDKDSDIKAFRHDVIKRPTRLIEPCGPGEDLHIVNKTIAISGSLTPEDCDDALVDGILKLGTPFFFLPHLSTPITLPNSPALGMFRTLLTDRAREATVAAPRLLSCNFHTTYQTILWKRLEKLPLEYRFPVIDVIHKLLGVCLKIGCHAGEISNIGGERVTALTLNLYNISLRGITLGIAGLAWYSLGFELGCSLKQARKLLKKLRKDGTMTLRDIQRSVGFKSANARDDVLQRLAGEGLIALEGKNVIAVSYPEFIRGLYTSSDFPMPKPVFPKPKKTKGP